MPRVSPDHRGAFVIASLDVQPPPDLQDPEERALFCFLKTGQTVSKPVELAYELYRDPETRHLLAALILGKATDEQISEATEISAECLPSYRRLFFDRSVFPHTISIINYINFIPAPTKDLYTTAVNQGPRFLLNRFKVGTRTPIDPKETIAMICTDSTEKFLTHRGNSTNSLLAREALKWGELALRAASVDPSKGGNAADAASEIRFALRVLNRTTTPEESGVKTSDVL